MLWFIMVVRYGTRILAYYDRLQILYTEVMLEAGCFVRGTKDIGLKCGDMYLILLISWKVGKSEVNSNLGIKGMFKQKWCN